MAWEPFLDTQCINFSTDKVISNSMADFYTSNSDFNISDMLEMQLLKPVLFRQSIEKAYCGGSRVLWKLDLEIH